MGDSMICFFCSKDLEDQIINYEKDLCMHCASLIQDKPIEIVRQLMAKCHSYKKREAGDVGTSALLITTDRYQELLKRDAFLKHLEARGVANWEGYSVP